MRGDYEAHLAECAHCRSRQVLHRTIDIGVNARMPIVLNTSGTVDATPPPAAQIPIPQDKASFNTRLPPVVRVGIRYKFLGANKFEHGDVENRILLRPQ